MFSKKHKIQAHRRSRWAVETIFSHSLIFKISSKILITARELWFNHFNRIGATRNSTTISCPSNNLRANMQSITRTLNLENIFSLET